MNVCIIGSYAKALVMTTGRIPLAGETLIGEQYRETYGGKGSDMAVQAARLGADVSFIGVIGNDHNGTEFVKLMQDEKIDITGLRVSDEESTGVGFIIKDQSARNIITIAPGANTLLSPKDIDDNIELIKKADVVLAQLEIPIATALYALKAAKGYGKITILNPAPALDLTKEDLSFVDILTPNETEARVAAGLPVDGNLSDRIVADVLMKTGCKHVVMTLGGDGVKIFNDTTEKHVDSYKIEVVDSNGAGDCFNASLATAIAKGRQLEEGIRYGNAVAALCCTKWETVPSYPIASEVEKFILESGENIA